MWLRKGDGDPLLVPDSMPDTIKRCLGDGWAECPDPRQSPQVSPEPAPAPEPVVEETPPPATRSSTAKPHSAPRHAAKRGR